MGYFASLELLAAAYHTLLGGEGVSVISKCAASSMCSALFCVPW